MWTAASSDDYFYGAASDGSPDDGADDEPVEEQEEPPPAQAQEAAGESLAAEVIRKLRAAGLRGILADPRRDAGERGDVASATIVRVKLARAESLDRAVAALDGLLCHPHPRLRAGLYVTRPPRSLAARAAFAMTARADLIEGIDFTLGGPDRARTADAATALVRITPRSLYPSARRNMVDAAVRAILAAGLVVTRGDGQLDLLVYGSEKVC